MSLFHGESRTQMPATGRYRHSRTMGHFNRRQVPVPSFPVTTQVFASAKE